MFWRGKRNAAVMGIVNTPYNMGCILIPRRRFTGDMLIHPQIDPVAIDRSRATATSSSGSVRRC
jgi:hypothetical protein